MWVEGGKLGRVVGKGGGEICVLIKKKRKKTKNKLKKQKRKVYGKK